MRAFEDRVRQSATFDAEEEEGRSAAGDCAPPYLCAFLQFSVQTNPFLIFGIVSAEGKQNTVECASLAARRRRSVFVSFQPSKCILIEMN